MPYASSGTLHEKAEREKNNLKISIGEWKGGQCLAQLFFLWCLLPEDDTSSWRDMTEAIERLLLILLLNERFLSAHVAHEMPQKIKEK